MPRLPNQNPAKRRKPFWDNVVGATALIVINGFKFAVFITYWALQRPNSPKVDAAVRRVRRETR